MSDQYQAHIRAAGQAMARKESLDAVIREVQPIISEARDAGNISYFEAMTTAYHKNDESGIRSAAENARKWLLEEAQLRAIRGRR